MQFSMNRQGFSPARLTWPAYDDGRKCENSFAHSYYKNSYVTWAPGILSRHLVNGCVLKCSCIGLMVFRNLSCLGIIICYINIIGIIPAYACNVLNVCYAFVQILQPLANVHETKWTRQVKRDCDVAVCVYVMTKMLPLYNFAIPCHGRPA